MIIELSKISEFISSSKEDLLIIGQPKGIGLTTEIVTFFCDALFFEEDCYILILCDDTKSKSYIINLAKDILSLNYSYDATYDYNNNFMKVYNNVLSVIAYKKYDKSNFTTDKVDFKFKYSYVDKDDNNDLLNYYISVYLPPISKQMIVATYDTPTSLYYIGDFEGKIKKVIVNSENQKENISKMYDNEVYTLEYETILKGKFNNEIHNK